MGYPRPRPARLSEKLLHIRTALGLSQNELISRMGLELTQNRISGYELGRNEPPLDVLLSYARVAGICLERLVDDELDLPQTLPARTKHKA